MKIQKVSAKDISCMRKQKKKENKRYLLLGFFFLLQKKKKTKTLNANASLACVRFSRLLFWKKIFQFFV